MVTASNGNSNWLLQGLWDFGGLKWAVGYSSGDWGIEKRALQLGTQTPDTHLLRGSKSQGSNGHRRNGGWLWGG